MGLTMVQDAFSHQIPEAPDPDGDSNGTGSLGVLILALGASEFVAFLICRFLAWYTDIRFYARESLDWIHVDSDLPAEVVKVDVEVLARALRYSEYEVAENADTCCPICLIDYDIGETIAHGSCCHSFHEHCLIQWLQLHESCPCCRQAAIPKAPTPLKRGLSQENIRDVEFRRMQMPHWFSYPDATSADFLFMF